VADRVNFQPVQPVRAYERVVEQIETAVLRGDLQAGQRLPGERELMRQFQVSRSTIREALRVLESNGLIRSRPGDPYGPELLAFTPDVLRKSLTRLASGGGVTLGDLLQFRVVLDGSTTYLAASLRTPEQLVEMEAALQAMRDSVGGDYEAFSQADVSFHEAVARASRNQLLQVCSDVVRLAALRLISEKISHAPDRVELMRTWLQRHTDVFEAIRAGDAAAAAHRARMDLYEYYSPHLPPEEQQTLHHLAH
jgi:GntR family transcriptional repressor for pyruvate dehydrogenase complex